MLRVGTSGDYAPFSKDGEGFDVDVATRMAQRPRLSHRVGAVRVARAAPSASPRTRSTWRWAASPSGRTAAVVGYMSRAVASGGPCVLSARPPGRVAVNRGGVLERWARERFAAAQIRTRRRQRRACRGLLERGEVEAIVTDSFELPHFARAGWQSACEPPRDRKVYWVSPARAAELGPRIDAWLRRERDRSSRRCARAGSAGASHWTAGRAPDRPARAAAALMPAVAAYKRAHGLPIDDPEREAAVLAAERLPPRASAGLERRRACARCSPSRSRWPRRCSAATAAGVELDLDHVLRPALSELGDCILAALAACAHELPGLQPAQLDLLVPLLDESERARLLEALRGVRPLQAKPVSSPASKSD